MTEPVFILEQVAIMKKHNFCFFILFLFVACNIEKTTDIVLSQEIIFPADNAVFSENQIINFISQGDFSNPTWISSLDGNLGSGKSIRCKLSIGNEAILLTEMIVREDNISLFGFADAWEKEWFNTLTKVQGVGAKVCLNILSVLTPIQLSQAIGAQDKSSFCQATGVGPKLIKCLSIP